MVLAFVYSSFTGYSIMLEIGSLIKLEVGSANIHEDQKIAMLSGHFIGEIGLLLFGIGVTGAALSPRMRSTPVLCLFMGGMIALGLAVLCVGFGNWQLSAAFENLAAPGQQLDPESFLQETRAARVPLLVGWFLVLVGAASIFAADMLAERASRSRVKSITGGIAVAVALLSLFTFLLSAVWSMSSIHIVEDSLYSAQPATLASGVVGVINSSFLAVVGIAGCAAVSLLLAAATDVPVHSPDDKQSVGQGATDNADPNR